MNRSLSRAKKKDDLLLLLTTKRYKTPTMPCKNTNQGNVFFQVTDNCSKACAACPVAIALTSDNR